MVISSDMSPVIEISGNVNFFVSGTKSNGHSLNNVLLAKSVPYTIPAGQKLVHYQTALDWSSADNYVPTEPEPGARYGFSVEIECKTNCLQANARTRGIYLNSHKTGASLEGISGTTLDDEIEIFGLDDRASSYSVDLVLLPGFVNISGIVDLPEGQVASDDLTVRLIGFDTISDPFGSGSIYQLMNHPISFLKGSSQSEFSLEYPVGYGFDSWSRPDSITNTIALGYSCASSICDEMGIVEEAWFTSVYGDLTVHPIETRQISLNGHDSDDSFELTFTSTITLLNRPSINVEVVRPQSLDISTAISGRLIVSEHDLVKGIICGSGKKVDWDNQIVTSIDDIYPITEDNCWGPDFDRDNTSQIVSEREFFIEPNAFKIEFEIGIQPQYTQSTKAFYYQRPDRPWHIGLYNENHLHNPYQTISFVCDSGCDNFPLLEVGFYRNGKFASRSLGAAQKFYLTEELINDDINISLIAPPVLVPILELLQDEED